MSETKRPEELEIKRNEKTGNCTLHNLGFEFGEYCYECSYEAYGKWREYALSLEAERDEYKAALDVADGPLNKSIDKNIELQTQLAATAANEARLREALEKMSEEFLDMDGYDGDFSGDYWNDHIDKLLRTPPSEAAKRMLEIEKTANDIYQIVKAPGLVININGPMAGLLLTFNEKVEALASALKGEK